DSPAQPPPPSDLSTTQHPGLRVGEMDRHLHGPTDVSTVQALPQPMNSPPTSAAESRECAARPPPVLAFLGCQPRLSEILAGLGECGQRLVENTGPESRDRKSTRLNSGHVKISYAVFCL